MRSLLNALPAALLSVLGGTSGAASQIQPAVVESFAHSALLSVRVVDGEPNDAGDHEAMAVVVSTITEMDSDGKPVGVEGSPLFFDSDNISVSSTRRSGVYQDGLDAEEVSSVATTTGTATTVSLVATNYLGDGSISTFEPSTLVEVGNETVRLDVRIRDWSFCTPFGRDGGRRCMAEPQDIFLQNEGALPLPPAPPPPHTLLIPRCDGETVATFRFVCDPRLVECADIVSVKYYLGEADQDPGEAPNTATIGVARGSGENGTSTSSSGALEEFWGTGVYERNLTSAEVGSFLNVSSLTPGLDYVFWSVWKHGNGSAPESNSRDFDLSRSQYWQCPGTTIKRNFEVGTSLSISLVVNGSTALVPLCGDSVSASSPDSSNAGPTSGAASSSSTTGGSRSCQKIGTDGVATEASGPSRRLSDPGDESHPSPALAARQGRGYRILQEDQGTNASLDETEGAAGWAWNSDGPIFGLGELSRIRLSSHVLLLGDDDNDSSDYQEWTPIRNTSSWVATIAAGATENEEGEGGGRAGVITASLEPFDSQAVFSALLFFSKAEVVQEESDKGVEEATWVAIAFGFLLLWLLGCYGVRLAKHRHAAKTWPSAVARAAARSHGGLIDGDASSFGSPTSSEAGSSMGGVKELQIFPMMMKAAFKSKLEFSDGSDAVMSTSAEEDEQSLCAPKAPGWTTPGSGSLNCIHDQNSSSNNNNNNNADSNRNVDNGNMTPGVFPSPPPFHYRVPAEAFPLTDAMLELPV
ncbi:unnamed protein product [Ectocarpus sp. 6 AP-2014]